MGTQLALMVNGPSQWYGNLALKFKKHHHTWLQQNQSMKPDYIKLFRKILRQYGHFFVFGYVQKRGKVNYLMYADKIVSDNRNPLPKPDNTAPDFAWYDVRQGKCKDARDYKYVLWLRIIHFEKIAPLSPSQFTNHGRRIALNPRGMKPLHFYVEVPVQFLQLPLEEQPILSDLESFKLEEEFFEGKKLERFSNYYERRPQLRTRSIEVHGTTCKACGFDFEKRYGKRGEGFIEVHHLRPVSELKRESKIDPATDMTVVCPNCHRMIHRDKNKILSLEELRALIRH